MATFLRMGWMVEKRTSHRTSIKRLYGQLVLMFVFSMNARFDGFI